MCVNKRQYHLRVTDINVYGHKTDIKQICSLVCLLQSTEEYDEDTVTSSQWVMKNRPFEFCWRVFKMFFIRKVVGKLTWKEEKNKYCNSPTLSILLLKYFCIVSQGMVAQVHKDVNEHYKLPTLDTGKSTRFFFSFGEGLWSF